MTADANSDLKGRQSPLRADRLITLYLNYPISKMFRFKTKARLPILMYHGIRQGTGNRHPYFETNTSPEIFARHMKFLREEGYAAIGPEEAVKLLETRRSFEKKVVLTFDDGFRDFYTDAVPVLVENHFKATLFLATGRIGEERVRFEGNDYLTWGEVRELHANGFTFGSHTVTHPELMNLNEAEINRELYSSKRMIEDKLGVGVKSFAYPYAFPETDRPFVKRLEAILDRNGYENGVSTIIGRATRDYSRFFLPRLPVNTWDDDRLLNAKLMGGYDWLRVPQALTKAATRLLRIWPRNRSLHSRVAK